MSLDPLFIMPPIDPRAIADAAERAVANLKRAGETYSLGRSLTFTPVPTYTPEESPVEAYAPGERMTDFVLVDDDGDTLTIEHDYDNSNVDQAYLKTDSSYSGVNVGHLAAPVTTLAILDRSGWAKGHPAADRPSTAPWSRPSRPWASRAEYLVNQARYYLRQAADLIASEAEQTEALKAEELKLDTEARRLYSAAYGISPVLQQWSMHTLEVDRERWRNAARAARTLYSPEADQ